MKASTLKKIAYPLITIFLVLACWEILAFVKNEPFIFPHLDSILKSFFNLFNKDNLQIIVNTLIRIIISVIITFVLSFIIGALYIKNEKSYLFFKPIISFMRSVPLAILSIFLFILSNSKIAPYYITILVILPVATEGVITALDNIDENLKDDLKLFDVSFFKKLWFIYIPLIKNYLLMIFVQIFGLGLKAMIMGEFICATKKSIGQELSFIKSNTEIANLIAWGILVILLVFLVECLVKKILKKLKQN